MTSGQGRLKFVSVIGSSETVLPAVTRDELRACSNHFAAQIERRNALIHAHPITDLDGAQILAYQSGPTRPLPDVKWPLAAVEEAIAAFDAAAVEASGLLQRVP